MSPQLTLAPPATVVRVEPSAGSGFCKFTTSGTPSPGFASIALT